MAGQRIRHGAILALFCAPIFVYWVYCLFLNPAPSYDAIDPEYEYFLNSLGVFKGQPYLYLDHPGTPVELIGSAILAGTYPWLTDRPEGFVAFHLRNPQVFLHLAYLFLAIAHLLCVLILFRAGLRSGQWKNAIFCAAIATMYFAIHPYSFSGSLLWSHNSFSFPFGTLLLVWLYGSLARGESAGEVPIWVWIGLGLGSGLLAATTIFLASWAVGILIAILLYYALLRLPWWKTAMAMAVFSASAVAGFYLAVLPVLNRMGGFWRWIYEILSHQSNYLAVAVDQPAPERIFANAAELFHLLPALSAAMAVAVVLALIALLLWRRCIRGKPALWAITGGLIAQMLALTLVFLDRPVRVNYFLSVAAILPVLALALIRLYEGFPKAHKILAGGLTLAVLTGLVINSYHAVSLHRDQSRIVAASGQLIQQTVLDQARAMGRAPDDLTILWMYGTYSPCWALWFGNHRTGDVFDREITQICPNQYELTGRVLVPNGKVPLEEIRWDVIFTCERYIDEVLARDSSAVIRRYPSIEWSCGKVAVLLNK